MSKALSVDLRVRVLAAVSVALPIVKPQSALA